MKIVKTPIIKSKQEQDTTSEIHKRYKEWEKFDSLIYRGKFEEIQKVEGGKSNDKDYNKQTDNKKNEDNATENVHKNNKASNGSNTKAST